MTISIEGGPRSNIKFDNVSSIPDSPVSGMRIYAQDNKPMFLNNSGDPVVLDANIASLVVGTSESNYSTIQGAIDAALALGASYANPYNIFIRPGTYIEDITIYEGMNLLGCDPATSAFFDRTTRQTVQIEGSIHFDATGATPNVKTGVTLVNLTLTGTNALYTLQITNPNWNAGSPVSGYFAIYECQIIESSLVATRPLYNVIHPGFINQWGESLLFPSTNANNTLFTMGTDSTTYEFWFDNCSVHYGNNCIPGQSSIQVLTVHNNCVVSGNLDGSTGESFQCILKYSVCNATSAFITNITSSNNVFLAFGSIFEGNGGNVLTGNGSLSFIQVYQCNTLFGGVTDFNIDNMTTSVYQINSTASNIEPSTFGGFSGGISADRITFNETTKYSYVYKGQTTNLDDLALPILTLPNNKSMTIYGTVTGNESTFTDFTGGTFEACVMRGAADISLVGVTYNKKVSTTGDFSITVDVPTQSVILHATGIAASTYNWNLNIIYTTQTF